MMIATEQSIVDEAVGVENVMLSLSLMVELVSMTRMTRRRGCFVEPAVASPLACARTVVRPVIAWLGPSKDHLRQHHYHRPAAKAGSTLTPRDHDHGCCHDPMRRSTTRGCSRSPATTHRGHSILHRVHPVSVRVGRGPGPSTSRETLGTIARRV
jgi:hypothetical protein